MKNYIYYRSTVVKDWKLIYKNLIFSLKPGSIIILKGQNGSGKSTFIKSLLNFYTYNSGLFYNKNNKSLLPFIFQIITPDYMGLNTKENVVSNINFLKFLYNKNNIKSPNFFLEKILLKDINISNINISFLSTGQKKRIQLLYFWYRFYPIWILDEPTIGLDIKSILILQKWIYNHSKNGGIIIIATHTNIYFSNSYYLFFN
jgi:heme exporter protein A